MTPEQSEALLSGLATLKTLKKPWRFLYLASAADGEPLLLVAKKIAERDALAHRKSAKNKSMIVGGWIAAAEDRRSFVFHPESEPPSRLTRDLKSSLGSLSPLLKQSTVAETGSVPGGAVEADREDASERTRKASALRKEAEDQQKLLQEGLLRVTDLGKRLGEAHFAKQSADQKVDDQVKKVGLAVQAIEDLKGKWFKSEKKKEASDKAESERSKLEQARKDLLAVMIDRKMAFDDLKEIHQLMDASEAAVVRAETAQAEAARARANVAAAAAVKAESELGDREREVARLVEERAKKEPALAKAIDAARDADGLAARLLSEAALATDEIAKLEAKLETASESEAIEIEKQLSLARDALDVALQKADDAAEAAELAQQHRKKAIAEGAAGPLAAALEALDEAVVARDAADDQEVLSNQAADEAEDVAERNAALRTPQIVIEGLSKSDFEKLVSFLPIGDPQTRVDFTKMRVGIGYDPLVYAQQNKLTVQMLDEIPPMKGHSIPKRAARFAAVWGTGACKDDLERRKQEAHDRGQDMVDNFDWDARKKALAGKEDALDKAMSGKSKSEVVSALLAGDTPGALFGESHSDPKTQNFLYDQFDDFVSGGVDTFYIEHITVELQPVVDAWLASDVATIPAPLANALYAIQVKKEEYPRNLVGLLEKAKAAGMNIQGIDTTAAKGDLDPSCDTDKTERVRRMNSLAGDVMNEDPKRKKKFVALTGAAHNTPHVGTPKPVPGIADLLGIVPVALDESGDVKADRGDPSIRP